MPKATVCQKVYITSDGSEVAHAEPGCVAIEFRFTHGEVLRVNLSDVPDEMISASAVHGLGHKIGDGYAAAKGDPAAAMEMAETVVERLIAGDWVRKGEGVGPRPSMLVDAVVAALVEAGETVDDERRKSIMEKLKTKEDKKRATDNPTIAAHYERLRAERAAEKAKAARKKAAESESGDLSGF